MPSMPDWHQVLQIKQCSRSTCRDLLLWPNIGVGGGGGGGALAKSSEHY